MYFTYVVRPGEAPEGRGPQFEPFWTFCVNYNLRLGLLIQLGAYAGLLSAISAGGKDPLALLSFFRSDPESVGRCSREHSLDRQTVPLFKHKRFQQHIYLSTRGAGSLFLGWLRKLILTGSPIWGRHADATRNLLPYTTAVPFSALRQIPYLGSTARVQLVDSGKPHYHGFPVSH